MRVEPVADERASRRSLRRHSYRRAATGLNVCLQAVLAAAALVMINYLASRYYLRWDVSVRQPYRLSEKTVGLLSGLDAEVRVVVFMQRGHTLFEELRCLLAEYEYAARGISSLDLRVEWVDPDRDLARTRELSAKYDVKESNVLVVESVGRKTYVPADDLVAYEIDYDQLLATGRTDRRRTGFIGEQAVSSAILTVVGESPPMVYFLGGHGERETGDFDEQTGYSRIARIMRRDNIDLKPLLLAEAGGVPRDCDALIIAGPSRPILKAEVQMLKAYLEKSGRLFVMLDPGSAAGLDALLAEWGVRICQDVAVGQRTLTGREVIVIEYPDHPITRELKNVMSVFYMPRCIEPLEKKPQTADRAADRPQVTTLVSTTQRGWGNADPSERPAVFSAEVDRRGPVSFAVAVEKGTVPGIDVEIQPTRLVVIGDSFFVANGAIGGAVGGNADVFLNAVNWLLEREALLAVAPKMPWHAALDMSRRQIKLAFLVIGILLPAVAVVAGVIMRWVRRS